MIGKREIHLKITLHWLIGIGAVAAGLIIAYALWEGGRQTLIFAAAVLAGSGALLNAVNGVDARVSQLQQAKKAIALDFMLRWLDPPLFHAKKNGRDIIKYFREHPSLEDQKAYLSSDPTLLANLLDILNIFEAMSIAIQQDLADEELLKRTYPSLIIEYWQTCEAFIKARRSERHNARILKEVEWLFDRWKD